MKSNYGENVKDKQECSEKSDDNDPKERTLRTEKDSKINIDGK
jgi:hypothetical protein